MNEKTRDRACQRCGNCCHVDVSAYVTTEEVRRWEDEGRQDIIDHVRANNVVCSGDRVTNRFGSDIKTCRMSCIYLRWQGPLAYCAIYETRTKVCRSYIPGSTNLCPQYCKDDQKIIS